jgi:hypothetical protein
MKLAPPFVRHAPGDCLEHRASGALAANLNTNSIGPFVSIDDEAAAAGDGFVAQRAAGSCDREHSLLSAGNVDKIVDNGSLFRAAARKF